MGRGNDLSDKELRDHAESLTEPLYAVNPTPGIDDLRTLVGRRKMRFSDEDLFRLWVLINERVSDWGPLTSLIDDAAVRDIAVNAFDEVWALLDGGWRQTDVKFGSPDEVREVINRLIVKAQTGSEITTSDPVIDARIPDGPRICAIIEPVSDRTSLLNIRKYNPRTLTLADLVAGPNPAMSAQMATFLFAAVRAKLNIIVSGGTGSGKTTLLSAMLGSIPASERVILIEDTPEITFASMTPGVRNVVRLMADRDDARRDTAEMLRTSLRMSPDRIVVGECRGGEALTMLQAMNTGHEGSFSTLHANSPLDALSRLETLVQMSPVSLPFGVVRSQIGTAIDMIIQIARSSSTGRHYVAEIAEVVMSGREVVLTETLFLGHADGMFESVHRPSYMPRVQAHFADAMRAFAI